MPTGLMWCSSGSSTSIRSLLTFISLLFPLDTDNAKGASRVLMYDHRLCSLNSSFWILYAGVQYMLPTKHQLLEYIWELLTIFSRCVVVWSRCTVFDCSCWKNDPQCSKDQNGLPFMVLFISPMRLVRFSLCWYHSGITMWFFPLMSYALWACAHKLKSLFLYMTTGVYWVKVL